MGNLKMSDLDVKNIVKKKKARIEYISSKDKLAEQFSYQEITVDSYKIVIVIFT